MRTGVAPEATQCLGLIKLTQTKNHRRRATRGNTWTGEKKSRCCFRRNDATENAESDDATDDWLSWLRAVEGSGL